MASMFVGKVAVVTGGGSGIGRATALAFAKNGAKVVIANRSRESGEKTVHMIRDEGGESTFVQTDVTKETDVKALMDTCVETYGRLDFLSNNAGAQPAPGPTTAESEAAWETNINVNLKGTWLCLKHAIPRMLETGGGAIVNTSAATGLVGFAQWTAQCASKHGVVGLTKAVALEYAKAGIRVNAVCPGMVRTPMLEALAGGSDKVDALGALEPVGHIGRPEDVASAVIWLCSDGAAFVTGHALAVDGGLVAQ